ncbi:MAG: hypothetical protein ABIR26_12495 [Ramlibacter sp.]
MTSGSTAAAAEWVDDLAVALRLDEKRHSESTPELRRAAGLLFDMDLGMVIGKLNAFGVAKDWSESRLRVAEAQYRCYMFLNFKYGARQTLPCWDDVDEVWHAHILDTRRYIADCDRIFGGYVHHFPYLGTRGPDDAQALKDSFEDTQLLYRREFGDFIYQLD